MFVNSTALSKLKDFSSLAVTYTAEVIISWNKSSAVAEMGDRAKARWVKKWGVLCPLSVGGAGSPSNTLSPNPRPTSTPSGILINPTVWPEYTNVTDKTDRG